MAWSCVDAAISEHAAGGAVRPGRLAHVLAAFGALLATLAAGAPAGLADESPRTVVFDKAQFLLSNDPLPPGEGAPWVQVKLPHEWRATSPGRNGLGWYRIEFELGRVPQAGQALEVDKLRSGWVDFYVNGSFVGGSSHGAAGQVGLGFDFPVLLDVSPALLRAGKNVLYAHMLTKPAMMNIQGLGRVRLGSAEALDGRAHDVSELGFYAESYFVAMAFTAGVIAFFLWLARRSDQVLLWYWISCLSWVGAGALYHALRWAGAASPLVAALSVYRVYGLAVPAVILAMRIAGLRKPWLERLFWAFLVAEGMVPVLGAVGIVQLPGAGKHVMARILAMDLINSVLLFAGTAMIIAEMRRPMRWTELVPAAALALMGACMFYEASRIFGWIDIEAPVLRQFHVPALIFAMGVAIFERHVRAIWRMERSNADLKRRVDEKAREIEAYHAEREGRLRQEALLRDRQRILADMHDGLGASLVGLLRYAQAGAPEARGLELRVKEALQELRIAIDALEPAEGDLGGVLGKLRFRLEPLIESAGARLSWEVDELPPVEALDPSAVFAIQRILLEAVSNAMQHAGAHHIRIAAHARAGDAIRITVEDDGGGFDPAKSCAGHGLANMRKRADGLGASLDIASKPGGGAIVSLAVPRRLAQQLPTAYPEAAAASPA